jgi:hypothetical protein
MSNKIRKFKLGKKQIKIVTKLLYAPLSCKERIVNIKGLGEIVEEDSLEEGWVTSGYLRNDGLIYGDQNKELVRRLGNGKNKDGKKVENGKDIIENNKIEYLDNKQLKNKLHGWKYGKLRSAEIYRLRRDEKTFKKLFFFFYESNRVWDFILSPYCKFGLVALPYIKEAFRRLAEIYFINLLTKNTEESTKNKNKTKSGSEVAKSIINKLETSKEKEVNNLLGKYEKEYVLVPPNLIYNCLNDLKQFKKWEKDFLHLYEDETIAKLEFIKSLWIYEYINCPEIVKQKCLDIITFFKDEIDKYLINVELNPFEKLKKTKRR